MRLLFAAALAALALSLTVVTPTRTEAAAPSVTGKPAGHKHFKLYVSKKSKHYHLVHTFKTAKEAHHAAHKYHKRGFKTRIRAV
jgi:hypothetical protein